MYYSVRSSRHPSPVRPFKSCFCSSNSSLLTSPSGHEHFIPISTLYCVSAPPGGNAKLPSNSEKVQFSHYTTADINLSLDFLNSYVQTNYCTHHINSIQYRRLPALVFFMSILVHFRFMFFNELFKYYMAAK